MKPLFSCATLLLMLCLTVGCEHRHQEGCGHDHGDCGHDHDAVTSEGTAPVAADAVVSENSTTTEADAHAAAHVPPHKQFFAEFPGHKYALELILDENSDKVTVLLGNAHFEPLAMAVETVELQAMVENAPKVFTLTKGETADGEILKYELTDASLKTLLLETEGKGISVKFELDEAPFTTELKKF